MDWPMALANAMAPKESTVTFDFHPSRVCSGMGYWKRGTLGGLAIGRAGSPREEWASVLCRGPRGGLGRLSGVFLCPPFEAKYISGLRV
jgi:hypothetical protein